MLSIFYIQSSLSVLREYYQQVTLTPYSVGVLTYLLLCLPRIPSHAQKAFLLLNILSADYMRSMLPLVERRINIMRCESRGSCCVTLCTPGVTRPRGTYHQQLHLFTLPVEILPLLIPHPHRVRLVDGVYVHTRNGLALRVTFPMFPLRRPAHAATACPAH